MMKRTRFLILMVAVLSAIVSILTLSKIAFEAIGYAWDAEDLHNELRYVNSVPNAPTGHLVELEQAVKKFETSSDWTKRLVSGKLEWTLVVTLMVSLLGSLITSSYILRLAMRRRN